VYRELTTDTPRQLAFGILLDPVGDGTFRRACEAATWRGLVAALLGDPSYEAQPARERIFQRLRLTEDARFLGELVGQPNLRDGASESGRTIDMSSDESLIRSLDQLGLVSLEPGLRRGWDAAGIAAPRRLCRGPGRTSGRVDRCVRHRPALRPAPSVP